MRAVVVRSFAEPARVETIADPVLRSGCVIVRVQAAFMPLVMNEFLRGRVPFALPTPPYVPGADAVGVVDTIADDVHGLRVGEPVYCDDWVMLRGPTRIGAYVGLGAMMPGGAAVLREWPNGCFADKMLLPAECVTPLGAAASLAPALLSRLGYIGTSYGALRRGGFRPADIVVVNGATGVLGVGTVVLLLALGASRIVALGRKRATLAGLEALDPRRVVGLPLVGETLDPASIIAAAGGAAQLFIDAIGFARSPALTLAGIRALGLEGHAVLIGGVDADIPIAYATQMIGLKLTIRGSEWFHYADTSELLRLVASRVFDLHKFSARTFAFSEIDTALAYAESAPGGFEHVALVPG